MKTKLLLILLISMIATSTVQAGDWRHHTYWFGGIANLLHPSGDWWPFTCYDNKAGQHICKFGRNK